MAEDQFIRDLAQKLANENALIEDWGLSRHRGPMGLQDVAVDLHYSLTPEQAAMLHVIDEKEAAGE